jgi:glycosyltransferase involved in cell wall biosynthesis
LNTTPNNKKKVIMSVISDLVTDQRVHKVCMFLHAKNQDVLLVGRSFKDSKMVEPRPYRTRRLNCTFRKGPIQYFEFNLRLFFFLLFSESKLLVSNDLDTLTPNFIISRWRNVPLVFDAHEYFTGVPELLDRPFKRSIWKWMERLMLPKLNTAYTVNHSIRELYKKEYGIDMEVIRNLPFLTAEIPQTEGIPFRLILQGAGMNRDRGIEEVILAMKLLPPTISLLLVGGGTLWNELQLLVQTQQLESRVTIISKLPFAELAAITRTAWLGITMDKPVSLNNTFSLPNKLFDYIHAGIPVLASSVPEVKSIIEQYSVGYCIEQVTPESIAAAILFIYEHPEQYQAWKKNTVHAARELNWELESKKLDRIYSALL